MNVLFLTPSYPTPEDPVNGVFVREQALAVAAFADVSVLHLARGHGRGVERVQGEPVPTWRSGFPRRPASLGLLTSARAGLRSLPRPDVIHAHFFLGALPAVLLGRSPVVTTEHWVVFLPEARMPLSPAGRFAARFALNRSRIVVAVSETLAAALRDAGVRSPIVVVPNVADDNLFRPPATRPAPGRLLTVGVLTPQKGIDVVLEAIALLPHGTVELEIAGDGPARTELEALAGTLGVSDRVTFAGMLPKPEVAEHMRRAGTFVLASRFESNGVVALEALLTGMPVIASDIAALAELVDESNGILFPPEDSKALASAIERMLATRDAFDSEVIAAAARLRFAPDTVGRALMSVYEQALR